MLPNLRKLNAYRHEIDFIFFYLFELKKRFLDFKKVK